MSIYIHIYIHKFGYIYIYIYIYIYSAPFYLATAQSWCFLVIERDGSLSTLCHSCVCTCQQRVLKTLPDPVYLRSDGEMV